MGYLKIGNRIKEYKNLLLYKRNLPCLYLLLYRFGAAHTFRYFFAA